MKHRKRIYIAGCGGMLGEAFYKVFGENHDLKCTDKDVNEDWLTFLDFRDRGAYQDDVRAFKPDLLFHLGAHTSLEFCEENVEDAYRTNTLAVEDAVHHRKRAQHSAALHFDRRNFRRRTGAL